MKKLIISFLKIFIFIWNFITNKQRVYYVSRYGNDNNSGIKKNEPLLTLQAALNKSISLNEREIIKNIIKKYWNIIQNEEINDKN